MSHEIKKHILNTVITVVITTGIAFVVSSDFRENVALPWTNNKLVKKYYRQTDSTIRAKEFLFRAEMTRKNIEDKEVKKVVESNNVKIEKMFNNQIQMSQRQISMESKQDLIIKLLTENSLSSQRKKKEIKPAITYSE